MTYVRDGNLFIVPVQGGSLSVTQLTDVTLKKTDARLTDSQRFIREEEEKLIGYLRQQKEEKQRAEEKAKLLKLPAFERPSGAKNTIVPNYVTETGYTEDIPGRTNVGDTQDLSRHGGHQRPLPGFRPARPAADRVEEGELGAGRLPGREPRVHGGDQLGG